MQRDCAAKVRAVRWAGAATLAVGCGADSSPPPAKTPAPVKASRFDEPAVEPQPTPARPPTLERLGNPVADDDRLQGTLGRSLWDVHRFGRRLFVGHGDGTANTGPTDVIAYHLDRSQFSVEANLPEEAIMRYRSFDGRLFVPGADPIANHDDGAIYVLESEQWHPLTIPDVVHVQDVMLRGNRLYASIQKRPNVAAVVESTDDGVTWRTHVIRGWRALALFEIGDAFLVSTYGGGLSRWEDDAFRPQPSPFGPNDPDPELTSNVPMEAWESIVERTVTCGDRTWAIVADGAPAHGYSGPSLQRLSIEPSGVVADRQSITGRISDLFVWERPLSRRHERGR